MFYEMFIVGKNGNSFYFKSMLYLWCASPVLHGFFTWKWSTHVETSGGMGVGMGSVLDLHLSIEHIKSPKIDIVPHKLYGILKLNPQTKYYFHQICHI